MKHLSPSELILNDDGSVYHLGLLPEHVADTVITVGDQARAERISALFDQIEIHISKREFNTYTGLYKGKRITVCSTGIGTDNIDIFLNELDAAVNIDLPKREIKKNLKQLNIIRIGTSGALQENIPIGSYVASDFAIGTDNLAYFYDYGFNKVEKEMNASLNIYLGLRQEMSRLYSISSSQSLMKSVAEDMVKGITITATGFYAPQGRSLRLSTNGDWMERLKSFRFKGNQVTNLEMETSGIYTLGRLMGHKCLSCSAILANRSTGEFAHEPQKIVDGLIEDVFNKIFRT